MTATLETLRRRANIATISEAANILGVSYSTVQQAVKKGAIVKVSGHSGKLDKNGNPQARVYLDDLEALLIARRKKRGPEMVSLHRMGVPLPEIAREFDVTEKSVVRALHRLGVSLASEAEKV